MIATKIAPPYDGRFRGLFVGIFLSFFLLFAFGAGGSGFVVWFGVFYFCFYFVSFVVVDGGFFKILFLAVGCEPQLLPFCSSLAVDYGVYVIHILKNF